MGHSRFSSMRLPLLARCGVLLLLPSLAGPAKALEVWDVDVAALSNVGEAVAEPINEERAVGRQSLLEQARWSVRSETWGGAYQWSLTNGRLVFDLTIDQTRHSSTLAKDRPWTFGLRETGNRRLALFEGPARSSSRKSFIDKLGLGWTPTPSRDVLPRQAWNLRLGDSDQMILRLRRGVLTVFAQRTF